MEFLLVNFASRVSSTAGGKNLDRAGSRVFAKARDEGVYLAINIMKVLFTEKQGKGSASVHTQMHNFWLQALSKSSFIFNYNFLTDLPFPLFSGLFPSSKVEISGGRDFLLIVLVEYLTLVSAYVAVYEPVIQHDFCSSHERCDDPRYTKARTGRIEPN